MYRYIIIKKDKYLILHIYNIPTGKPKCPCDDFNYIQPTFTGKPKCTCDNINYIQPTFTGKPKTRFH